MKLGAFKFIGYYDEDRLRIYETCDGLDDNKVSKIYYYKDYSEYLFLKGDKKIFPSIKELEIIHMFVMQKEMYKKDCLARFGISAAVIMLISLLKCNQVFSQNKNFDVADFSNEDQITHDIGKSYRVIDEVDIKNKLIEMINRVEVNLVDRNYRILYYLYYMAFANNLEGEDFLDMITLNNSFNARFSYRDFFVFYVSDKFNYKSVINDPKGDSLKVTYENLDMFLELNMLLEQEVVDENITQEEYNNYIKTFGTSLQERDSDLYRVWSYKVKHSSMFGELVNLKYLVYRKMLNVPN